MKESEIKVGEYKGASITYDPENKKFQITLEVEGVKQTFKSTSEIALRKQVDKAFNEPPIEVIEVSSWREVFKPVRKKVVISGARIYELSEDGKKKRTSGYNLRMFDEKVFQKMNAVYREYEKLCARMDKLKAKLKKVDNLE